MKIKLLILVLPLFSGCAFVPTDMFPKPTWYWSAAAEEHRAQIARNKAFDAQQSKANESH
jgi:hypothetical protein